MTASTTRRSLRWESNPRISMSLSLAPSGRVGAHASGQPWASAIGGVVCGGGVSNDAHNGGATVWLLPIRAVHSVVTAVTILTS